MDLDDVSSWLGRPGPSVSRMQRIEQQEDVVGKDDDGSNDIAADLPYDDHQAMQLDGPADGLSPAGDKTSRAVSDQDYVLSMPGSKPTDIRVTMPKISEETRASYSFLTGHFAVKQVLSKSHDGVFKVELESGEIEKMHASRLENYRYGTDAREEFHMLQMRQSSRVVPADSVVIDWSQVSLSGADSEDEVPRRGGGRREIEANFIDDGPVVSDDDIASNQSRLAGRRSSRLARTKTRRVLATELVELSDSDENVSKRTRRHVKAPSPYNNESTKFATRRSGRGVLRRSMREKQEDEISSASEKETGPKIVGTKELFMRLSEQNIFRRRHRQDCDTCSWSGDHPQKGPLVFCQGCTNAHHKACLGSRGTREHLVTKAGDELFVLQCRKCIGVAHDKDKLAPHHGVCTSCSALGVVSTPFRTRLTTKQEQLQREENNGLDPITLISSEMINNVANVMFRCAACERAWHMHHLPDRKVMHSDPEDEQELSAEVLAQKRFDIYHRSWICKDCVENQHLIDGLVAWRPTNTANYIPGTPGDTIPELQKEYLIKWRGQSYLRVTWMPGSWIWGIVSAPMRSSFAKKIENALPKMTTKDAVPEEYLLVDIVFDVRYTSVVRNSSKEIDLVRAKEVESAFVKYKGLGYEDSLWEKPPSYLETERWIDFTIAYEDYVKKMYLATPSQSSLRRHLQAVRTQNFGVIARQTQPPSLTGGELMQYQLEGLNWLYHQWFISHGAILADEMGLGKTIQVIALFTQLVHEHKCWPFLVVVPNSTCPNWRREIRKWAPSLRVVTYYGSEHARKLTRDFELFPKDKDVEKEDRHETPKRRAEVKDIKAHIVVVSYESIIEEKTRKSLLRVPWQGLVVDEGQRLKNDKNLIYECLSKFNFPFKLLMTGTPLQNNARELFNLVQFLDKSIRAADLEAQYSELTEENVPELREKLRPFFLRRTKVQVLTFLPPMAQIIVPVTMSSVQKRVYKSILSQNPHLMKAIFKREGSISQKDRFNLNNILMQLRKTLCHPFVYSREIEERTSDQEAAHQGLVDASAKLQLLQVMLPKLQERGHRVLMFSQFLDNLDIVEDFLDGLGMLHRRLDGSINALEKQKRIDEFNAPDSPYFVFLLSTRAGGVGINLATADTVIILDPDFNPHQDIQALSRAHRIGQKDKVLVFQLMVKGSVEEKIMAIGKKKMALDHVLIERMDQADDAGENLESILRFGAEALFEEQNDDDRIIYDSTSIDKLLDRSKVESTKTSADQSAESQFSFARVWANNQSTLDEGLNDTGENESSNTDIWDKILAEREKAYQEELARKEETFGRGKRKRGQVDYSTRARDLGKGVAREDDSDYMSDVAEDTFEQEPSSSDGDEEEGEPEETLQRAKTVRVRPFMRARVPVGPAPYFNGNGPVQYIPEGGLHHYHKCTACHEEHPLGWCRLKLAGVEHCGLCGQAHMGYGRTCPHLNDERQVDILLATLKESTEPHEVVEGAQKYLKLIRSHLVSQRRAKEKVDADARARAVNATKSMANANARLHNELSGSSSSRYYVDPPRHTVNGGRGRGAPQQGGPPYQQYSGLPPAGWPPTTPGHPPQQQSGHQKSQVLLHGGNANTSAYDDDQRLQASMAKLSRATDGAVWNMERR